MRKLITILVIIFCIFVSEQLFAQAKYECSISPYFSKGLGHTKWVMEQFGDLGNGILGTVKSELEYPLDAIYGGIDLKFSSVPGARKVWSITLSVGTKLKDPSGIMLDHDWISVPGIIDEKISYTESSVKMKALLGRLEGELALNHAMRSHIGLVGGIRYQHFDQELYDLQGWQLDENLERYYFSQYQDTLVGTYKITYTMPNFGMFYRYEPSASVSASLRAAISIALASDEDDHVLRYRLATARGSGFGFIGGMSFRFVSGSARAGAQPFVELEGELIKISASPKQTIEWYGDDPITPDPMDDETGLILKGIPHKITSSQGYLTARVGLAF